MRPFELDDSWDDVRNPQRLLQKEKQVSMTITLATLHVVIKVE